MRLHHFLTGDNTPLDNAFGFLHDQSTCREEEGHIEDDQNENGRPRELVVSRVQIAVEERVLERRNVGQPRIVVAGAGVRQDHALEGSLQTSHDAVGDDEI